jgi:predicted amidohydrolase
LGAIAKINRLNSHRLDNGEAVIGGFESMTDFKIAAAQIPSIRGEIATNIETHAAAIAVAARHGVGALVFPELSLTGYEPDLAAELAMTGMDERLAPLSSLAQQHLIDMVLGAPLRNGAMMPHLGGILLGANGKTTTYAKMHLGPSERTYFVPGSAPLAFESHGQTIGVAICADTSQPSHPQVYAESGCTIYAAGVFLNAEWYATDMPRLAPYAARYRMLVVMANHAQSVGTYSSVGKSAVWLPGGALLSQADGAESCLVIANKSQGAWSGEVIRI